MSETSVKIIKNEIRCRDDTMPKTVDTRSHCKVRLRACNNLPQPPPYISVFWGCGRLLHALNLTLQWLLVSTVFGMVSSLHLISFLMIFTLVYCIHCLEISLKFHTFSGVIVLRVRVVLCMLSWIVFVIYVAPPTQVDAWSMAVLLGHFLCLQNLVLIYRVIAGS